MEKIKMSAEEVAQFLCYNYNCVTNAYARGTDVFVILNPDKQEHRNKIKKDLREQLPGSYDIVWTVISKKMGDLHGLIALLKTVDHPFWNHAREYYTAIEYVSSHRQNTYKFREAVGRIIKQQEFTVNTGIKTPNDITLYIHDSFLYRSANISFPLYDEDDAYKYWADGEDVCIDDDPDDSRKWFSVSIFNGVKYSNDYLRFVEKNSLKADDPSTATDVYRQYETYLKNYNAEYNRIFTLVRPLLNRNIGNITNLRQHFLTVLTHEPPTFLRTGDDEEDGVRSMQMISEMSALRSSSGEAGGREETGTDASVQRNKEDAGALKE